MTDAAAEREALQKVIQYLTDEFIVEECIGNITEGCMSCEMIGARASLRKAVELIDAFDQPIPASKPERCGCVACEDGTLHLPDCAVHNEPAYPNGPCDCWALHQPIPDKRGEETHEP